MTPHLLFLVQDFPDDFEEVFSPLDSVPQIMLNVAAIRDVKPHNPSKLASVVIGTPDAIQLASCVLAVNEMNVTDITFHALDWKSGTKAGEKTVPIVGLGCVPITG